MSREGSLERDADMKDASGAVYSSSSLDRADRGVGSVVNDTTDLTNSNTNSNSKESRRNSGRASKSPSPSPCERRLMDETGNGVVKETHPASGQSPPSGVVSGAELRGTSLVVERERERTRRYGSGGSSSSSGLSSMDTLPGGGTSAASSLPSSNGNADVFIRIRDLSEERGGGTTSSGEEQVSDMECHPHSGIATGSTKKSKLSGSSDSGVSDVSTNEPLPLMHPAAPGSSLPAGANSAAAAVSVIHPAAAAAAATGVPAATPLKNSSNAATSLATSSSSRPSRRVSRLSTDSSGDGVTGGGGGGGGAGSANKSSLPRIIPLHAWDLNSESRKRSSQVHSPLPLPLPVRMKLTFEKIASIPQLN